MTIDYEPITPPGPTRRAAGTAAARRRAALGAVVARDEDPDAPRMPRTVILLPGFGAGPRSMRVMDSFLRRRGHRVRDWGLGVNTGDARSFARELERVVEESIAAHGEPVVLVGWSLGGYIAREYAREHPDGVRRIVTLGSPVIGGPRYTATSEWYRSQGHDLAEIERAVKTGTRHHCACRSPRSTPGVTASWRGRPASTNGRRTSATSKSARRISAWASRPASWGWSRTRSRGTEFDSLAPPRANARIAA